MFGVEEHRAKLRIGKVRVRVAEHCWKAGPQEVTALYAKPVNPPDASRVPRGTRNPVGSREDHLPRLNTNLRPIVN
jgi:hypothetical protein